MLRPNAGSFFTYVVLLLLLLAVLPFDFEATCTGSDPCHACKNCHYCKHCAKDGGTCGVCKRSSQQAGSI
jgi:hypothetical protein